METITNFTLSSNRLNLISRRKGNVRMLAFTHRKRNTKVEQQLGTTKYYTN